MLPARALVASGMDMRDMADDRGLRIGRCRLNDWLSAIGRSALVVGNAEENLQRFQTVLPDFFAFSLRAL